MTSSALSLQEAREEARPAEPNAGIRIASVESTIDDISLKSAVVVRRNSTAGPFDFEFNLSESGWTDDSLSVRYSFTFGRPSSGQACRVGGKAVVRFSQFNPRRDFRILGDDITNEMAVEIFRKNYEAVYLLSNALAMDAPSPWITQDVSLSSRSQAAAGQTGNQ